MSEFIKVKFPEHGGIVNIPKKLVEKYPYIGFDSNGDSDHEKVFVTSTDDMTKQDSDYWFYDDGQDGLYQFVSDSHYENWPSEFSVSEKIYLIEDIRVDKVFKKMKIFVASKEISHYVQKMLFEMGYSWGYSGQNIFYHNDHKYLFTSERGDITYGTSPTSFASDKSPEYLVNLRKEYDLVMKDETVIYEGNTYIKKDFEAAIARLTKV